MLTRLLSFSGSFSSMANVLIEQVHQKMYHLSLSLFLDKDFKFQPHVCNGFRDALMMSISILNIGGIDYRCIINGISKSKAVKLL